ncbi:MAG: PAS domain-containing sensor histidine kinase [Anaerolineae bacterium]|nr:PAS domain-containing sensor histidine kinase [Anaerolineae bacterium]
MTSIEKLPTRYAPAERYSPDELAEQMHRASSIALLPEIFDAIPDLIMLVNDRRQIIFANRALRSLAGISSSPELDGRRPGELFGCMHSDKEEGGCGTAEPCATCGALRAVLNSQRTGALDIQESRFTRQDGVSFDFQVHAVPIDLEGETYTVVTVKDISHEKRRRALERVFFHDILNVMTIVLNSAYMLRESDAETEVMLQDTLEESTERLLCEILSHQGLLAAEDGDLAVELAAIDSLVLLTDLVAVHRHSDLARGVTLFIDPASEPVRFESDPTLLRRVLGNMVKNALEAAQPGETVTVKCLSQGDEVEFSVHNSTHIPRNAQLQIFQRSFSTKGKDRGLGTYGMRLLTEQYLHGRVYFTSTREQGTTFFACYPITPPE